MKQISRTDIIPGRNRRSWEEFSPWQSIRENSFSVRAPNTLNQLPKSVNTIKELAPFKAALGMFLEKVPDNSPHSGIYSRMQKFHSRLEPPVGRSSRWMMALAFLLNVIKISKKVSNNGQCNSCLSGVSWVLYILWISTNEFVKEAFYFILL